MMSKFVFISIIIVVTAICAVPTAAGEREIAARIATVHNQYGFHIEYNEYGAHYIDTQLRHIETALPYLGTVFMRRVNNTKIVGQTPRFSMRISDDRPVAHPNAVGMHRISLTENVIHLYPSSVYIPDHYDILHEFGHAAMYLSDGEVDPGMDLRSINGHYNQVFDPSRYISSYAMTNDWEDFSEMFAVMIYHAGEHSYEIGEGTVLYQKLKYVQEYLVEQLGPGSRAARRASAFMGIDLENMDITHTAA